MSAAEVNAMRDLIERLEVATGPCRELDAAIALAIGIPATTSYGHEALGNFYRAPAYFKHYTASIDAALTLVPTHIDGRNVFPQISKVKADRWDCHLGAPGPAAQGVFASAPTPALAICIAALRAKGGE